MPDDRVTVTMLLKDLFSRPLEKIAEATGAVKREMTLTTKEIDEYEKVQERARREAEKTTEEVKKLSRGARTLVISFNVLRGSLSIISSTFNRFKSTVTAAFRAVTSLKTAILGLALGFALRQIARSFFGAAEEIDRLAKTARSIGLTTNELVKLSFAAERSGLAFEQLRQSSQLALRNISNALEGKNQRTAEALTELGLSAFDVDLRLHPLSETIVNIAEALDRVGSPSKRISLLNAIFGEEASIRVIPLFAEGADGIRKLYEESERLFSITDEQAAVSEKLIDSLTNLKLAWLGLRNALIQQVGPAITEMINRLAFFVADAPDRIRGIARALRDAFSTDIGTQQAATKLFSELRNQVAEFIATLAVESGRVIGTAFLEAISIGLVALTPVIEDVFRDALGPILSAIPGIDVEQTVAKRIDKLKEVQKEYDRLISKVAELEKVLDEDPRLDGQERTSLRAELSGTRREIALLEGDLEDLDALLAEQSLQQKERAEAFRTAVRSGFEATTEAASTAREQISAAGGALEETLNKFQAIGEDAPVAVKQVTVSLSDLKFSLLAVRDQAKTVLDVFVEVASQIPAAVGAIATALSELRARELSALGQDDEASRVRLLNRFLAERAQLEEQFGDAARALLPELERIQAIELARFDAETKVRRVIEEVTEAEEAYKEALQRRNEEAEAGRTITEEQEAAVVRLRATLEAAVQSARANLQGIAEDARFADLTAEALRRVEVAAAVLGKTAQATERTFREGLIQGIKDFAEQSRLSFETARRYAQSVLTTIGDGLVGAIRGVIDGSSSMKDALIGALRSIAIDVAALTARILIMKAIASSFGGGFGALLAATGGIVGPGGKQMQRFATGGFVGGGGSRFPGIIPGPASARDITPVLAMPGEGFIRKSAVEYYGKGIIAALNGKLIPRELLTGTGSLTSLIGKTHFAQGGIVAAAGATPAAASPVIQPAIVADDFTMERLISGGSAALMRFLRDNRGQY